MKKFIPLVCLLVLAVFSLFSCSDDISFEDYAKLQEYEDNYPVLNSYKEIQSLKNKTYKGAYGNILVFEREMDGQSAKVYFYNAETDTLLDDLTVKKELFVNCGYFTANGETFLMILSKDDTEENPTYTLYLYDDDGTYIASKNYKNSSSLPEQLSSLVQTKLDLFMFNGVIYRVDKEGKTTILEETPFANSLPSINIKTDNYYYELHGDDDMEVVVYDKELKEVYYWELAFDADRYINKDRTYLNVLSEEKVLVQYWVILPGDATEYDLFYDGGKYNVESILIDVENGEEEVLDLDYIVEYNFIPAGNSSDETVYPKGLTDLSYISYFEDGKLLDLDYKRVSLDGGDASVKGEFLPELDYFVPSLISPNHWVCQMPSGSLSFLDEQGKVVESFYSFNYDNMNNSYILKNGKLYNFDLNMVYDIEAAGFEFVKFTAHNAILVDRADDADEKDEYYLYNGTTATEIENYDSASKQYYVTKIFNVFSEAYEITYYNEQGAVIYNTVLENPNVKTIYTLDDNAGFILAETVNGEIHYYRISK